MNVILLAGISGIMFQRSIGAYQIAHYLRGNSLSCQVIDFIYDFNEVDLEYHLERFIDSTTLCIGISTTFLSDLKIGIDNKSKISLIIPEHVERVCLKLKSKYPHIKFCIGGSKSTHGTTLPWVDAVFHGYCEDEFLFYCQSLQTKKKRLVKKVNGVEVFDMPNTVFDIENLQHKFIASDCITRHETLPIEIARGCIFKCKFCAYPLNGKKKLDYVRKASCITDEMKHNYFEYGVTNYFFTDDTFNDSEHKLELLHEQISKLPFKIRFTCYLRLDLLLAHRKMIPLLLDMGLTSAFFGIESFCQDSLKCIGKNVRASKIKEFLHELYYEHWQQQVSFNLGFIVGLPGENEQSIIDTINYLSKTPHAFHFEPLRLSPTDGFYQSEFQKNSHKFGYQFDEHGSWYSEHFTESLAEQLATRINKQYSYSDNPPSAWTLFSLLNHFDIEYLSDKKMKQLSFKDILLTRKKRVEEYKQMLVSIQKV